MLFIIEIDKIYQPWTKKTGDPLAYLLVLFFGLKFIAGLSRQLQ